MAAFLYRNNGLETGVFRGAHLYNIREYGLVSKILAFQFEGNDYGYIVKLSEQVASIKAVEIYSLPSLDKVVPRHPAPKLNISLQATDARHAISACIDMQKTRGIAWVATTRIKDGKQETEIAYTADAIFMENP